ncbi:cdc42 effector protein 2-like [Elgaria multicarinata webbii]|uniref:cdc42 effector protein 2-like n=1 Tax=Elgaria multicarinata webbii TaxID=159646 RepID=UPI002FCD55FD
MPAKTPIYLKTSTPKRGRKLRLRDVLSSDMISPPLGDFRHSAHIGLDGEGDMFGELSFLQGKYDLLPHLGRGGGGSSSGLAEESFGRCSAGASYRTLLKSAVSLPMFSGPQGQDQAPPKPPRLHLEEMPSGGQQRSMSVSCASEDCFRSSSSAEGLSFSARGRYDPLLLASSASFSAPPPEDCFVGISSYCVDSRECPCGTELPRSESLLRLDLDLGPSILDDVLRIMEEYQQPVPKAL